MSNESTNNNMDRLNNLLADAFAAELYGSAKITAAETEQCTDIVPYIPPSLPVAVQKNKPVGIARRIWRHPVVGALVYAMLAMTILVVVLFAGGEGSTPRNVFGFSAMRVLTESMQSELPRDSLIITRQVGAENYRIGDDISFFINQDTVVTHRIVGIYENHEGRGIRAFRTWGIENERHDHNVIPYYQVIGRVVFNSYPLGRAAMFVQANVLIVGAMLVMLMGLVASLRMAFRKKTTVSDTNN